MEDITGIGSILPITTGLPEILKLCTLWPRNCIQAFTCLLYTSAFCYIVHAGLDSRGIGKGYPRGNRERRVAKRVLIENTEAYLCVHLIPDSLGAVELDRFLIFWRNIFHTPTAFKPESNWR